MYWSYPILPFGIVACTFLPTTFLEIAVCYAIRWPRGPYWERLCPRAILKTSGTIRTDLSRWITFLFFSYWNLKFSGKFYFSLHRRCVVGVFVLTKSAIDCKTKLTKLYNMTFNSSNYYHNWPSFRIKKGLCIVVDKSWSVFVSN